MSLVNSSHVPALLFLKVDAGRPRTILRDYKYIPFLRRLVHLNYDGYLVSDGALCCNVSIYQREKN